jgi:2'-hydroxyisoflavone reductase
VKRQCRVAQTADNGYIPNLTHMKTTRRQFIRASAATAAAVSFGTSSRLLRAAENPKPLKILILGGTGFTGPYQIQFALSRGHTITTFNRGKTHPGETPKEVEQ